MRKAERDLGAHPKIMTAETLLRAAAAWIAKQSSDPNTRRRILAAANQNSVRFAAGLCS
jgi:hypothetical protein